MPPEHVGKSVILRASDDTVRILADGVEVARHGRGIGGVTWKIRPTSRSSSTAARRRVGRSDASAS